MSEYEADCNELIAAGYGGYDRDRIPKDWRTRPRPAEYSWGLTCTCGICSTCRNREKKSSAKERARLRKVALGPTFRKTLRRVRPKKALDTRHE